MEQMTGKVDKVIQRARQAVKARPRDPQLHSLIAPLYEQSERFQEALPHLAFLMAASSVPPEELVARYAKALYRTGAFAKAVQVLDEGIRHSPASSLLLLNKALALQFMGAYEDAVTVYASISANDPSDRHATAMAGYLRFLITDMREGYEAYAMRPMDSMLSSYFDSWPLWAGEPLAGKRVVLWSEQGIGDVIMFLGLLPWVIEQGASVSVVVTAKLAPVVSRSFPGVTVISEDGLRRIRDNPFDYHVPVGDLLKQVLPRYVPSEHPAYLKADAESIASLRAKYLALAGERGRTRLVGISWHTTNESVGFSRNVALSELYPLFSLPKVQFVSLQYGDHADGIADINRRFKNVLFKDPAIDAFEDIAPLAAQAGAMDEIITIDNFIVHLAGALGVPTTLLLSSAPDWRWGLQGQECRWYKSVRLERQEAILNWKPVISRLRESLEKSVS